MIPDHIGIAVKDIQKSNELFCKLFGAPHYKTETVEGESVITSFFKMNNLKIELLQAIEEDSPINKFIEKRGEGIHHLAFEVTDIYKEISRLKKEGFELINEDPKPGADNMVICFLHPKSTNGVLVELCQARHAL